MSRPTMQGASPLLWPSGWVRTPPGERRRHPSFSCTLGQARDDLAAELERLGATGAIFSSDLPLRRDGVPYADSRPPADPGVAVYFDLAGPSGKSRAQVLACDRWTMLEHNLRAISLHVGALRGIERWGVGSVERAFTGYAALPEPKPSRPWREVLEVSRNLVPSLELVRERYRDLSKLRHPDAGGSAEAFSELVRARELAELDLGGRKP